MPAGDITPDDGRQPKLWQVVFEVEREDTSTVAFEHDPGAGIRGRIPDVALLELRGDGEVTRYA